MERKCAVCWAEMGTPLERAQRRLLGAGAAPVGRPGGGAGLGEPGDAPPGKALPCGHAFHEACIQRWLAQCHGRAPDLACVPWVGADSSALRAARCRLCLPAGRHSGARAWRWPVRRARAPPRSRAHDRGGLEQAARCALPPPLGAAAPRRAGRALSRERRGARRQGRDPTCPFCNSVIHLEVKYRLPWTGLTAEVRRARAPRLSLPLLMVFFPARCVFNCLKYFKVVDQVHIFMAAPFARPAAAGQCLLTRRLHVQEQALAWAVQ